MLVVSSRLGRLMQRLPHQIFIQQQFVGLMRSASVAIQIPAGVYQVRIMGPLPFLSTSATVDVRAGVVTHLDFAGREKWWDILFTIDILLSLLRLFVAFPTPWNWIYEIATNGFFVAWLVYEYSIRKRYYRTQCYHSIK